MSANEQHILSYKKAFIVLVLLLILTGLTVVMAEVDLGYLNVVVALALATSKSLLVIMYFMHLQYERPYLKGVVFMTFLLLAIFIGFTFFDVSFRGGS
ncbi:cytochrome C oxidase subunit IV family protein [Limisalsivibrio acetivorans]|uniref:cytochrome C oxidase subunit IV family protein n=1 Tax=Limisalsivibrio acetivorans TaxID=1304888 RepID=UPI0003B3A5F1|nr:cytochrome C oxidase subunit IV family protein [Limisalsivibrio acetivorans]